MTSTPTLRQMIGIDPPAVRVLDIGAMAEGNDCYQPLVEQGLAEVTGFEPSDASRARLNARSGPYRYLANFLGDGNDATFHETRYPGCSSLFEPDPAMINLFNTIGAEPGTGNFSVTATSTVPTTRLDDVTEVGRVDYLKIDVQGAELLVLENATRTLEDVLVLETEVEFVPLYKQQCLFGDLHRFLHDHGLLMHKLIEIAGRPFRPLQGPNPFVPLSQLLWADAVFVRDFTRLERYSSDQLLRAALVLNDVYQSIDLVHLLLVEHDRRRRGGLAARYIAALQKLPAVPTRLLTVRAQP